MSSKVTVVMPVYNVEKYLIKSVNSVCDQSYKNLQIILVDDGSTDSSGELCDALAKKDNRISVIHKQNGGLSDARNAGMAIAEGEFICFIDSDDWIEPDTIEYAVNCLEDKDISVIVWSYVADFTDANENLLRSIKHQAVSGTCTHNENPQLMVSGENSGIIGYAWNKLYRLELLKRNGFQFEKGTSLVEDILFNRLVFCETNSVMFSDKMFTHYMQRPRTTLGNKYYDDFFNLKMRACKAVEDILLYFGLEEKEIFSVMNSRYFGAVKSYIRMLSKSSLNFSQKIGELRKSKKTEPFIEASKRYGKNSYKDKFIALLIKYNLNLPLLWVLK